VSLSRTGKFPSRSVMGILSARVGGRLPPAPFFIYSQSSLSRDIRFLLHIFGGVCVGAVSCYTIADLTYYFITLFIFLRFRIYSSQPRPRALSFLYTSFVGYSRHSSLSSSATDEAHRCDISSSSPIAVGEERAPLCEPRLQSGARFFPFSKTNATGKTYNVQHGRYAPP